MRGRFPFRALTFAALTPLVIAASARASATFSGSSTALIVHNADDVTGGRPTGDKHVNPPPTSASMPSYQYAATLNYLNASTTADASVGELTTSTITGFVLAPGTGVQQTDPSNVLHSSELVISVSGIWNISGSQGPTATGYLSFSLAGTVGSGGSAAWSADFSFTNQSNVALRSPINTGGSFGVGAFSTSYTSNVAFSPTTLPNGSQVDVNGTITLTADADDPTSITLPDFEVSDAPPTSRFVGTASGGSIDFDNESNWSSAYVDPSTNKAQTVPNGTGLRASFVGAPVASTNVTLSTPTTLGTLDIDEPGINIVASESNPLTFSTFGDNACLLVRNVQGESAHNISGNIILSNTLEVENDGATTSVNLAGSNGQITGSGGLMIDGPGLVTVTGPASYTGNTTVAGGTLTVDQSNGNAGSLATTPSVDVLSGATLHLISANGGLVNLISSSAVVNLSSASEGATNSQVILDLQGGIQYVGELNIDGVPQPAGLYTEGTTGDGIYFTGDGYLDVLSEAPEPASLALVALPALLLLRRSRTHVKYQR
jgi:autotransporter-associated beta strand protein